MKKICQMFYQLPLYVPFNIRIIAIILSVVPSIFSADDARYIQCGHQFQCGGMKNISYPFWGDPQPYYCGLPEFKLECQGQFPTLKILSQTFRVLIIDHDNQVLRLTRLDLYNNTCPSAFMNTTISYLFSYTPNFGNLTMFFGCSSISAALASNKFRCHENGTLVENGYFTIGSMPTDGDLGNCTTSVTVPVLQTAVNALRNNLTSIDRVLNDGFEIHWITDDTACIECAGSGGRCGYNSSYFKPICFCPDKAYLMRCQLPPGNHANLRVRIFIAASAFGAGILLVISILCVCFRRNYIANICGPFRRKIAKKSENLENILEKCGPMAPKRYRYSDIKKMTASFKDKLGQGGYGVVYKGKLQDGCLVAVKVLNESTANGEEFVNEVSSISRTSHVNIVTLLGFCFEGSKRALIYEFMPNGSLDNYIYGREKKISPIGREKIYHIAIGIAQGLQYLHHGCNTRILHLDIKPQNFLLDQDFSPKISDFGLAKLCLGNESNMSRLGTRGTVGYIAPEVFSRNFGVVSCKSDVYSYGMMILEMASGRKNIDTEFGHSSESYFPHWIYNCLLTDQDTKLQCTVDKAAEEIARKMILVGLWCIQTDPANRPSIDRMLDMLQGSHEILQIPPKPFPSSPNRKLHSATTPSMLKSSTD
ncbi:LEAF RUST 10 DISEASE-RESISTANCE LOCUS RECEPTOR-LIKE PROTEIN KINASE-like 2.1 [Olea europaea var. sylvestris]|uniref:LEAF RUST 10 DISEASE-RESISTANCE LOCUS RECEPTOR-LIKE PROTEIN KINASE-like 2.1 n=1 Tax=Olea europaea var. sylvestris TaxID=158386 RepID=UPI000C1CD327|nr:LEAF RUST 10 DISEASE-RESISTANCE LOCUS RECEPTOR-LIKE PROTEIN KINASE-like 2.1 [Olea europaea var. sylvestris]